MSAATKYAPPTASGAVGRTPVPRQQRGEGRGLEEAGGLAEQPVSSQLSALFPIFLKNLPRARVRLHTPWTPPTLARA